MKIKKKRIKLKKKKYDNNNEIKSNIEPSLPVTSENDKMDENIINNEQTQNLNNDNNNE